MKPIAFFFLFLPVMTEAVTGDSTAKTGITAGVEIFQSAVPLGIMHYNYQQWIIHQDYDFTEHVNPAGYGIFIQKNHKNSVAGMRLGFTPFMHRESGGFNNFIGSDPSINTFRVELKQNQMQLVLFFRQLRQFKKFRIGFGLEIPFVYYTEGWLNEFTHHEVFYRQTSIQTVDYNNRLEYKMPSGYVSGLGAGLDISYPLSERIEIGLGMNIYYLWHTHNKPIFVTMYSDARYYNTDGTLYSSSQGSNSTTMFSDVRLNGFSRILPNFRLGFNLF